MPTFLQAVTIPEKCFLQEVLFWVAFQRLPIASYTTDGTEFRDDDDIGGYAIELPDSDFLNEDECATANIPPDPRFAQLISESTTLSVESYDKFLAGNDLDDATRAKLETDRNDAVEFERTCAAWKPHYATAIEYPAARIFVALKSGLLRARGRLLPGVDVDAALANLSAEGRDVYDLPIADIAPDFWSLKGIDFESSAARNHRDHYCHVYCDTHEVLAGFPGDKREPVYGVEKIGECFVITDAAEKRIPTAQVHRQRGRPPYHWEAFHLEIAELIRRGDLPAKKEAAIQYFQDWLARALGIKPSRAAIGEKLKPYYDRFVRMADKKS